MDPYWFNAHDVREFFAALKAGMAPSLPEIMIEVYFSPDAVGLHDLRGVHNSRRDDVPGISVRISPAKEYQQEITDYFTNPDCPDILPTEWYEVDWRAFSDERLTRRPRAPARSR